MSKKKKITKQQRIYEIIKMNPESIEYIMKLFHLGCDLCIEMKYDSRQRVKVIADSNKLDGLEILLKNLPNNAIRFKKISSIDV